MQDTELGDCLLFTVGNGVSDRYGWRQGHFGISDKYVVCDNVVLFLFLDRGRGSRRR